MKFAFSTSVCPGWDLAAVVGRAAAWGYDGVEVRGHDRLAGVAGDVWLDDPEAVRNAAAAAGVAVACLASPTAMTGRRRDDDEQARQLRDHVGAAARVGCGVVRLADARFPAAFGRGDAVLALGDWLLPLGDYAAERGVLLVVENVWTFRTARSMWAMLDRLGHPAIACCWSVLYAASAGEPPDVSVPILNSRIQYARVQDAAPGPQGTRPCKVGEGQVPIESLVRRLRGIGYAGYVTVTQTEGVLPSALGPEDVLPDAVAKLKQWRDAQAGAPMKPARGTGAAHVKPSVARVGVQAT